MSAFRYKSGELHAEDVSLARIARDFGTPCYVYSRAELTRAFRAFDEAFAGRDHLVCYAVKANSNVGVLDLFARLDSGFDIVSGGELERVIAAGGDPGKVVFSGVGKTESELRAALDAKILCFNVESAGELERLERVAAELGTEAPVSLRVNPDVDAQTHPYIATGLRQNKFGIPYHDALGLYRRARAMPHLRIEGVDCHIGSQLTDMAPIAEALGKIAELAVRLENEGIRLRHIDVGGGLGIRYQDEMPPVIEEYARTVLDAFKGRSEKLVFEPGRLLCGNAGVLLTRVEYAKHGEDRNFAVIDAAMNDLLRPALYDAWHDVLPVREGRGTAVYDVVGPICESGDFIARGRTLAVQEGEILAIMSAGAYAMSMASNYNSRPRAPEVMVDGDATYLVRERETTRDLFANEHRLP